MNNIFYKTLFLTTSVFLSFTSNADVVDFEKLSQTHKGKSLTISKAWESIKNGDFVKFVDGGINLSKDENSSGETVKYAKAFSKKDFPLTVSIDLTYEQIKTSRGKDLISIGFTNGESQIKSSFVRYGYGNYLLLSSGNMIKGAAVEIEKIGLKTNEYAGKSDSMRFSLTLDKDKNGDFFIYSALKSVNNAGDVTKWGFEKSYDVKFTTGSSEKIYGFIQSGHSDKSVGVGNRIISKFEIGKKQADKVKVYIPKDIDFSSYILPMKPVKPLVSEGVWGDILPRDTSNGIESIKDKPDYCYWDGSIVKDDDGNYHIYGSRWDGKYHHSEGWNVHSKGMHAVSTNGVMGPYIDKGLIYPQWQDGKGHNVVGVRMFDGRYAVTTSEITQGEVFISDNPDGPFEFAGEIKVDLNGFRAGLVRYDGGKGRMSNVQIIKRHDNRYMIVPRNACILISEGDITGPYKIMTDRIFNNMEGVPQRCMEDPTAWYSGGMYHMLVNHWMTDTTYYFSSIDGINDWKYRGIAFKKHTGTFRYEDGTDNDWAIVQRPTAYVEDGYLTHINFSVIDITKGMDGANDTHGSKIIIVPFDGKRFAKDMRKVVEKEQSKNKQ